MPYTEITTSNLLHPGTNLDFVGFDRMGAEAVFRMLLEMGATKDIKLLWNETNGTIRIMKRFSYPSVIIPTEEDDGHRMGDQFLSLRQFIKFLIRFDRAQHKRMKNVEKKIYAMHSGIELLQRQLNN